MAQEEKVEIKSIEVIQTELLPLQTEVVTFKDQAEKMIIKTDADYEVANNLAGVVNSKGKSIDTMRKFLVGPLNAHVDSINAIFMPQVKEADAIVKTIKAKMGAYFDEKETARLKEEKRLQDIRDKADAKRAEAGKEAIAEPVREVAPVAKTVVTAVGKSSIRKTWEHEIVSIDQLPEDIKKLVFAEAYRKGIIATIVQKMVDAGVRDMTGVRIYEKSNVVLGKGK